MMLGIGSWRATFGGRFGVAGVLACISMWCFRFCFLVVVWPQFVQENRSEFSCIECRGRIKFFISGKVFCTFRRQVQWIKLNFPKT